jgi:hypothetical protein
MSFFFSLFTPADRASGAWGAFPASYQADRHRPESLLDGSASMVRRRLLRHPRCASTVHAPHHAS